MSRTFVLGIAFLALLASRARGDVSPTPMEISGRVLAFQYKAFEDPKSSFASEVYAVAPVFSVLGPFGDRGTATSDQLFAALFGNSTMGAHRLDGLHPGRSADGNTVWFQFQAIDQLKGSKDTTEVVHRGTEIAVFTKGTGFRVVGGMWSVGVPNAAVNEAAAAGKLPALASVADAETGDKTVIAAFKALFVTGLDATAAARRELFTLGSAPDEDTRTGKELATAWKRSWVGKAALDGPVRAEVATTGTTAWVVANVKLSKTGKDKVIYTIPFRLLVVFDKVRGKWTVVHAHFATPSP